MGADVTTIGGADIETIGGADVGNETRACLSQTGVRIVSTDSCALHFPCKFLSLALISCKDQNMKKSLFTCEEERMCLLFNQKILKVSLNGSSGVIRGLLSFV